MFHQSLIALLLVLGVSWSASELSAQDAATPKKSNEGDLTRSGWRLRVEDVGREDYGPHIEVRSDGTIRVLRRAGRSQLREVYSGHVDRQNLKEIYDAAIQLHHAFTLENRARADIGRDDDSAESISLETWEWSFTVWFRGSEQRRDRSLTEKLGSLYSILNKNLPADQGRSAPIILRGVK